MKQVHRQFAPNEDQVFDILRTEAANSGTHVDYLFLPPADPLDRMVLVDGYHVGNAECKSRTVPYSKYDTLMVDALKWDAMIAAENRAGLPTSLFYAFSDGGIYKTRPAHIGALPVTLSTPRRDSLSLNAGVERPVVRIPRRHFVQVAQVHDWPQQPTFVRPLPRSTPRWRRSQPEVCGEVESVWGGTLVRMHPGYPVSHWLRIVRPDGVPSFGGWVDVSDTHTGQYGEVSLPAGTFFGAARQEAIFVDTPSWIVARDPRRGLVACRPAVCGPVQMLLTCDPQGGPAETVTVPEGEWVPLAEAVQSNSR